MKVHIEALYKTGTVKHDIETDSFDNPVALSASLKERLERNGVVILGGMVLYAKGLKAFCVTKTEK